MMFLNYVIAVLSICLYLNAFFPIPARPNYNAFPNNVTTNSPKYAKLVVFIIDALRLDFVSDTKTPFLSKESQKNGCFIQLKVETPTVTLPRIKALTTGNVPQFVDIILNLASPTKVEDSFIHRAHANGKKIVFYGDDIWVKLFPEQFLRYEGTSSFFVNDYTEVDDNVTRNVHEEIDRHDWDIMILHYLGLDHIGHVYGPKSSLIISKLQEMDSIIQKIHEHTPNTLFMITGDHGMRDRGGHGGSTYPEVNVPLVILGMSCFNDTFAQVDIPANLAVLLGFDIPATSIGQLQDSLLSDLSKAQYLQALKYNTIFLRNKIELCDESIETANHFLDLFLLNGDVELGDSAANIYKNCAKEISERLLKTSTQQDLGSLVIAVLTAIITLLKIIHKFCDIKDSVWEQVLILLIIIFQFVNPNSKLVFGFAALLLIICIRDLMRFKMKHLQVIDWSFLTLLSIAHPLIFLSSSFLEEEHQFWYFFINTFIVLNMFTCKNKIGWFLLLAGIRFIRTINQVGDKWAAEPDLADWLLEKENNVFLKLIFILGLFSCSYVNNLFAKSRTSGILNVLITILIYVFRVILNENVILGQTLWFLIFSRFVVSFITNEGFLPVWILIISLLLKPYNVIIISVCLLACRHFCNVLKKEDLIMAHWWLGNLLFFTQGHDNSLASVDISTGYIGLKEYHPLFVFPQVLCHTYAFPVLSHLLLFSSERINVKRSLSIFVLFRLYVVIVVFLVTFIQRHHLFIWSVFAPKIFVEASHFGILFIETCCYYFVDLIIK